MNMDISLLNDLKAQKIEEINEASKIIKEKNEKNNKKKPLVNKANSKRNV